MINAGRGRRMRNMTAPLARRGAISRSTLLFLAAAAVLAAAVGMLVWDRPASPTADDVHLACAAGLRAPVEQVVARYQTEADCRVLLQYGGSNTLVSQLVLSKTGDLVLLADDSYLATLAEAGLLAETLPVAEQQAVLCVARGNPKQIGGLTDLAGAGVRTVLGSPDQAAIGKVTRTALEQARLWDGIEQAVRDRGGFLPTVPEVVNAVKVGAADAAIAWRSNVVSEPDLEIVPCPELDAARGRVVIAVLTSARSPTAALRLARYLTARDRGLEAFAATGYEVGGLFQKDTGISETEVVIAVPEAVAVQPLGIARSSDFKWLSRRLMDAVTRGRAAFEAAGFRWRHDPQPATP